MGWAEGAAWPEETGTEKRWQKNKTRGGRERDGDKEEEAERRSAVWALFFSSLLSLYFLIR